MTRILIQFSIMSQEEFEVQRYCKYKRTVQLSTFTQKISLKTSLNEIYLQKLMYFIRIKTYQVSHQELETLRDRLELDQHDEDMDIYDGVEDGDGDEEDDEAEEVVYSWVFCVDSQVASSLTVEAHHLHNFVQCTLP